MRAFIPLSAIVICASVATAAAGLTAAQSPEGSPSDSQAMESPFDPASVVVEAVSEKERIALALERARVGRFTDACASLRAGLTEGESLGEESRARIAREIERLDRLIALRDEALDHLIGNKTRVTLRHDGKATNGNVDEVADGVIRMTDYRGKSVEFPLSSFDPGQLASVIRGKKIPVENAWVTGYANLISEKKDGEKLARKAVAKDSSKLSRALSSDMESYAELRATAAVLASVREAFSAGTPQSERDASAILEAIRSVLDVGAASAVVERHRDDLRRLAELALVRQFESRGLAALGLQGDIRQEGEGIVVSYDCGETSMLEDFSEDTEYLAVLRGSFGGLPDAAATKFEATERGLLMHGQGCWRHDLEFEAPLSVLIGFEYGYEETMQPGPIEIRVGVCDDAKGSYISSSNAGDLLVYDTVEGIAVPVRSPLESIQTDLGYLLRIEHDGKQLTITNETDRQVLGAADVGRLTSGRLFLWFYTNVPTFVTTLELSGTVDREKLATIRDAWMEDQLTAMFGS